MFSEINLLNTLLFFAVTAIIPFILVAGTSFAKVSIVLAIIKNAFGSSGIPPLSVLTALAIIISFFIMAPVAEEIADNVKESADLSRISSKDSKYSPSEDNEKNISRLKLLYDAAYPPIHSFLKANTPKDEIDFYSGLTKKSNNKKIEARVLFMAFASSQFLTAIMTGILILLPFLMIDLIVGTTLTALGLTNIPVV
ncbi:MAG: EscR/YscR/HrcR family type III secretion system export apparatus protein, partial [Deltaproteobacteria bacterium]|nr:EscR/YscR/HrcR family type III secretion system export apparatus protein [Deltaproteobacteria bacterium]